jgi:LysR family transcriptional regulator (chromosome initiation inhibitor)
MLDRDQLETFAVVIEQQSFEKAATALSITRGAVSQRIKALEESLSTVLVLRDRPVSPTPAGEVLLRHVKALRVMEGSALQALAPQPKLHAPVPLSIAVNADSLATWFPEVLKELLLSQLVALEVVADDQDHTSQLLSRGEVIGCISTSAKAADGFAAECLGAMEYRCYATPEFAASAFPDGLTVPTVLAAPAVLFNRKDSLHDDFLKSRFGFSIDRYAKHFLPSPVALLEGVAMGAGYGLIPSTQAQPLVDSGRLIDLCPNHGVMVDLYWHHWELEPPLAHDITALIVKVAQRELVSRAVDDSVKLVARSGDSATRLCHVSPLVASNKAKADCNTH